ncbi:AAA family ATPase [Lichenihabitans sp. PAMC28606]|uniref:YhaN family protein n=1 Tax=Lichenihabitans sp. PAMC28606 TaxID=2880932 RepID=UPI001D0B0635|nr:YhaN family protein [Lichenihabitans sp. PAMC28606]UDL93638.1 AAA family ATPase [Lichenihabitans sp. PAMC28606]
MRLDELVLERYGAIEHRRLTLNGPGLTVVYGPNEAGKSTCLAALTDFLFRIPERTLRGGVFGTDVMRIGATLSMADGRCITLKRRAGRGKTLIDQAGAPCDDAVLATLLGSTTRERFEHLFGLDHESLRQGGDQLLLADGEIGRLIVEAGGGLRSLMRRLDAIDAEIDTLFAPRRKESRAFYKALDAFEDAEKVAKAAALTRDAYERDRKTHETALRRLSEARAAKRDLAQSLSRLQRVERVIPTLRELDAVDDKLALYAEVTGLAEDFADRCTVALSTRDTVAADLASIRRHVADLSDRLDVMAVDTTLAEAEAAVRDIEQGMVMVSRARNDRANRLKELGDAEAELAGLRQRLGVGPDADLEPLMPPQPVLDRVLALAADAVARRLRLDNAREASALADEIVRGTARRIEALVGRGRHEPFGASVTTFAALPVEAEGLAHKSRQILRDADILHTRTVALGFVDIDALRALVCPPADQLRLEIEARTLIAAEVTRQVSAHAAAIQQREIARADIDRLRQGGEIATDAALAAARAQRHEAWLPIRAAHLAGRSDRSDIERSAEIAALDVGLAHADQLADSRTSEAQRVATLVETERRLAEASAAVTAAETARAQLARSLERRLADFCRAFPEACERRPEAPALLALVEARADMLARAEAIETARLDAEQATRSLAPRLRQFEGAERRALLRPEPGADLAERVQALAQAIATHDQAHAAYLRDERDLVAQQSQHATARRLLAGLEQEEQAWIASWGVAATQLGLPADAPTDLGATLASQWNRARGELRSFAQTRRRLLRMDEDEAALTGQISALAAPLGIALADDTLASGAMLVDRWRHNNTLRLGRDALVPERDAVTAALQTRQQAFDEAEIVLKGLAEQAALPAGDDAALKRIAERRRDLSGLRSSQTQFASTARRAGEGLDLDVLRREALGQDLDAVRAEVADLKGRLDALDQTMEAAIRDEQSASKAMEAHEAPSAVQRAVVDRERATADMHAAVERYVELRLARDLVTQAIQRVRSEQQDPLIRAAGAMFARMTQGQFDGVEADVDQKGAPVVRGIRSGGRGSEAVATMSDGTRDQLFLAFRLASLANYCAATEPLPFVADDILVHFDDRRGAATLDLLAEFATTTQVLLFTHHQSVLAAGERLAEDGRASIVTIA